MGLFPEKQSVRQALTAQPMMLGSQVTRLGT